MMVLSDTHILLEAAYTTLTHNEVVDAWSSHFPNNWHQSKGELKKVKNQIQSTQQQQQSKFLIAFM